MKQQIIEGIRDPEKLENLYRSNQRDFEKSFAEISAGLDTPLISFWKIRLAPDRKELLSGIRLKDLPEVLLIAAVTALLMLIPAFLTDTGREFIYIRDVALIAFNGLIIYSFRINKIAGLPKWMLYGAILLATGLYINLLPAGSGDSLLIAALHVPLMLWCFLGLSWLQFDHRNLQGRMDFIRFTGELIIMTGLILLAGGLLTGITLGLFQVIGMNIEVFYFNFIAAPGAAAAPVIAWFLIRTYPGITSKIAPVIARVFTPVVLVTLTVYLVSLLFSDGSIVENRELLIIFNVMLLGVLALIIYSLSGINREGTGKHNLLALFLLALLAIVINSIALFVIVSRVSDGLTPNRAVVLVTNALVFINLIWIAARLFRTRFMGAPADAIEKTVSGYLTVYAAWTLLAVFVVPLAFGFR
jgi:hypothetical protein